MTRERSERKVCAERSREALSGIVEEATINALPTLVVGPAPVDDPAQNARIDELSRSFAEICGARDIPLISVFEPLLASSVWIAQVAADDGAHPASDGYAVLAQLVLAGGFQDWLAATGANASEQACATTVGGGRTPPPLPAPE